MPFRGRDFVGEKHKSTMLSRRQINVQRDNLISMCRISVKALLDYACLNSHVDDECEEFINFCAVFEQMVSHRLRPNQKKVWLPGPGSPRHFWDVLLETHSRAHTLYFQSCVPNIDAIESFKAPQAKLRAFIRVALMEKRLSDYVMWILDHQMVLRNQYLEGAVMLSEQASVVCGDLIGLNAIDFNFCLKGNENEFLGPLEISYARFLRYKQSAASRNSDEIEMLRLNRAEDDEDQDEGGERPGDSIQAGSILTESNVNDILRLQQLERDFRSIKEQKDYLEELARLRERQVSEANIRLENMRAEQAAQQKEWERERRTMDSCILELQADITKLFQQNERFRFQVASYRQFKDRLGQKDVQLVELPSTGAGGSRGQEKEASGQQLSVSQTSGVSSGSTNHRREGSQLSSDVRSLQSTGSDSMRVRGEDSHSMVPLTGSLVEADGMMFDPGSQDTVKQRLSQCEAEVEIETDGSYNAAPIDAPTISRSDPLKFDQGSAQQLPASVPDLETIMMESFVMTENRSEIEMAVRESLASNDTSIVEVQDDVTEHEAGGDDDDGLNARDDCDADDDADDNEDDDADSVVKDGGEEEYDDIEKKVVLPNDNQDVGDSQNELEKVRDKGSDGSLGSKDLHSKFEKPSVTLEPEHEHADLAVSSELEKSIVTSNPEELIVTSEPEELAVTSEPEELAVTSEPEDLAITSDPEELVVTSEPEELVVTSEPELVDQGNTSSDGSDAAWDMVSDSEPVGEGDREDDSAEHHTDQ